MMKVVYSYNKKGREDEFWRAELTSVSTPTMQIIPFNHDPYLDVRSYVRAQMLDNLYYANTPGIVRLYADIERLLLKVQADVLIVDNAPPYHPEFLRKLDVYKALRVCDGPLAAYDRDFAYQHAYDHVLYHSEAYSRDLTMGEKLAYCGAKRHSLWPLWLFNAAHDSTIGEAELFRLKRKIDVCFVGSFARGKMADLARIKKHFGRRCVMHGLTSPLRNVYFNVKHGFPGWMTPVGMDDFQKIYRQSKIGFNIHNRGKFTCGDFRMFELPANGAMQVSDGDEYLQQFFIPGEEIVSADSADAIIKETEKYLAREDDRQEIAVAAYRAVMSRHRMSTRFAELEALLSAGILSKSKGTAELLQPTHYEGQKTTTTFGSTQHGGQ